MSKTQDMFNMIRRKMFIFIWRLIKTFQYLSDYFSCSRLPHPCALMSSCLLSDFSGLQGNPVGQSGLGMAYLYGRGVQVVSVRCGMLALGHSWPVPVGGRPGLAPSSLVELTHGSELKPFPAVSRASPISSGQLHLYPSI